MAPERRMDDEPGSDLVSAINDLRFAAESLAEDLLDGLGRVAAHGGPHARLRRWPHLCAGDRIEGVHGPDVPAVEVDRVVEEEIDLLELLFLNVEYGVGERAELACVIPVPVSNDDLGDVTGVQPDHRHLDAEVLPAARGVPVEDVCELLPAGVVQGELAVRPFDDPDVHRQVDERRFSHVRRERAGGDVHACAALDDPRGVQRSVLGAFHVLQETVRALETALDHLWRQLGRPQSAAAPQRTGQRHESDHNYRSPPLSPHRSTSLPPSGVWVTPHRPQLLASLPPSKSRSRTCRHLNCMPDARRPEFLQLGGNSLRQNLSPTSRILSLACWLSGYAALRGSSRASSNLLRISTTAP